MNDGLLLRRYLEERDEPAFLELVKRHMNLVYSTALRRAGNAALAQDIAQAVFLLVATKAARLTASENIAGWLHRATCLKAAEHLRAERRRQVHEKEAANMNEVNPASIDRWAELAHQLDEAVDQLDQPERELILRRFYTRSSWQEIGSQLGLTEDAARMRLKRALEKLRGKLAPASAITVTALADWLETNAAPAAPGAILNEIAKALPVVSLSSRLGVGPANLLAVSPLKKAFIGAAVCSLFFIGLLYRPNREAQVDPAAQPRSLALTEGNVGAEASLASLSSPLDQIANPADAEVNDLLARLRSILYSNLEDGVLPPQDLRTVISGLSNAPQAVFAVLRETIDDPSALHKAHQRATWGLWLLGESAPELLPQILPVLTEIIASPEKPNLWADAADVLHHLSVPEGSIPQVMDALARNPAAGYATIRFLTAAARRHSAEIAQIARSWLPGPDPLRFCAAMVLVGLRGEDSAALLPLFVAGVGNNDQQYHAIAALEQLGPAASSATPELRSLLSKAEAENRTWLRKKLIEVLASVAPESRSEILEVDTVLRDREQADALGKLLKADPSSIPNLIACLKNPGTAWKAALDLEELGPRAADALPALREALAEPDGDHKSYLADAIKAIDPASPKPLFERNDLLASLRAVSVTLDELGPVLEDSDREAVAEWSRDVRNVTPEQLAAYASDLGRMHPKLREDFVSNLLRADPALDSVLRADFRAD